MRLNYINRKDRIYSPIREYTDSWIWSHPLEHQNSCTSGDTIIHVPPLERHSKSACNVQGHDDTLTLLTHTGSRPDIRTSLVLYKYVHVAMLMPLYIELMVL